MRYYGFNILNLRSDLTTSQRVIEYLVKLKNLIYNYN